MESVGSNSPESPAPTRRRRHKPPSQALAERIDRALRQPFLLLHRSDDSTFFVMGSTANVYTVTLTVTPNCTCPDRSLTPCKHILFVYIRVLGVAPNDPVLHHRRTLRICHLSRLLATPTSPDSLADPALSHRFREIFFSPDKRPGNDIGQVEVEDGVCCPVCLEEMVGGGKERLVACRRCRNPVHEECLKRWKRSQGRRWASCVICRERWKNVAAATDKYLNLAAYLTDAAGVHGETSGGCGGG